MEIKAASIFFVVAVLSFLVVSFSRFTPTKETVTSGNAPSPPIPRALLHTPAPPEEDHRHHHHGQQLQQQRRHDVTIESPDAALDGDGSGAAAAAAGDGDIPPIRISSSADPNPQTCFNSTNEDVPQDLLVERLVSFRPSFRLSRKVWSPDAPVFPHVLAPSVKIADANFTVPVMKQFLYCYTKTYVNVSSAPENSECLAEMADPGPPLNDGNFFIGNGPNDLSRCKLSVIKQGNVTRWADLAPIVQQFPGPLAQKDRTLAAVAESRRWYWRAMPDPFKLTCPTCVETKGVIQPSFLVGARRWFPLQRWLTMTMDSAAKTVVGASRSKLAAATPIVEEKSFQCLVFMENAFRTTEPRGPNTMCSGKSQPKEGDVGFWKDFFFHKDIVDVAFAQNPSVEDGFFIFSAKNRKGDGNGGEDGTVTTHLIQPVRALYGINAIWTSLQMLFGFDSSPAAVKNGDGNTGKSRQRRGLFSESAPVIPRNISLQMAEAGCFSVFQLSALSHINSLTAKQRKNTKFLETLDLAKRCWRDIIAPPSSAISGAPVPPSVEGSFSSSSSPPPVSAHEPQQMAPQTRFDFLPCYPSYITALLAEARRKHNMDSHDVYWAYSCRKISHRRPCLDERIASMLRLKPSSPLSAKAASASGPAPDPSAVLRKVRMSDLVRPRVAVCMSGFIRSFHLTRHSIFKHLVDPHDADFFASTWNVQGRAKKTLEVLKGHLINVERMRRRLVNLIPRDRNVTRLVELGRYRAYVFSWNLYKQALDDHSRVGWRHAGLYMLLSHSIELAMKSGRDYDILVRGRFDLVPLTPLVIYPVWVKPDTERRNVVFGGGGGALAATPSSAAGEGSSNNSSFSSSSSSQLVPSWLLDTGSACEMDGFWWPRTAILRPGVVVAHTADTRFKLFSWQYCDWLHIGTFDTMKLLGDISGWAIGNYVDSGAQFVEHVYAIDRGIRFLPMQLYLKIMRETRKKKRGKKKEYKIRQHLFG